MKIGLIATLLLFSGMATYSQKANDKDLPVSLKEAFMKQFPNAKNTKWEKETDGFEAEFVIGNTEHSAVYSNDGIFKEDEVEISLGELPKSVLDYITKNYSGQKVKEAAKITDAKGIISYEAEIKGMDLLFDNNGKFIKEVKE